MGYNLKPYQKQILLQLEGLNNVVKITHGSDPEGLNERLRNLEAIRYLYEKGCLNLTEDDLRGLEDDIRVTREAAEFSRLINSEAK